MKAERNKGGQIAFLGTFANETLASFPGNLNILKMLNTCTW